MNLELEKKQIITELLQVNDEWILKAIKKLLDIDEDYEISEEHKKILDERIAEFEANESNILDWETVKKELLNSH